MQPSQDRNGDNGARTLDCSVQGRKRTGRTLIVDAYAAEVLKATGYDSIPKPVEGWPNIAIFIPQAQRVALKRKGIAPIVDSYRGFRVWPDNLAEQAPRSVMLFRGWMLKDLKRAGALVGARVFWSQWDGYARCIAFYLLSRLGFAAR
jgi:ribonuclease J